MDVPNQFQDIFALHVIERLWDMASPEVRQRVADSMVETVAQSIAAGRKNWEIENIVDDRIRDVATEVAAPLIESRREELGKRIAETIERRIAGIAPLVDLLLQQVVREASEAISNKMQKL